MHFVYPYDSYDFSDLGDCVYPNANNEHDFSGLYESFDADKDDKLDFSTPVEGDVTDEGNDGTSTLELGLEPGLGLEL